MRNIRPSRSRPTSARARRARSGSILIMVVAVLVLLALMGTAYMSTVRIDRLAGTSDPIEPPDVSGDVARAIVDDLYNVAGGTRVLRDPSPAATNTYEPWESPVPLDATQNDNWLGSRLPILIDVADPDIGVVRPTPAWRFVSRLLPAGAVFVDIERNGVVLPFTTPGVELALCPTSVTIANVTTPPSVPKVFPAFRVVRLSLAGAWTPVYYDGAAWSAATTDAQWKRYIAADADGDGVADSLLFRLNATPVNGVYFYGAVRVIDDNSAINAAVAWASDPTFKNFTPASVDLYGLLTNADTAAPSSRTKQNAALNQFRFNNGVVPPTAGAVPVAYSSPADDNGAPRNDFEYVDQLDAFWNGLGRRPGFPGYNGPAKYQAIPASEWENLAYRFCMLNPNTTDLDPVTPLAPLTTAMAPLERRLQVALYGDRNISSSKYKGAFNYAMSVDRRFTSYPANRVNYWYDYNFNFTGSPGAPGLTETPAYGVSPNPAAVNQTSPDDHTIRPLIVARNPVSNLPPNHFGTVSLWSPSTGYTFGSWVNDSSGRSYVCVQGHTSTATDGPGTAAGTAYWELMPWTEAPAKTSINTATFNQLWLAFWSVMRDPATDVPVEASTTTFRNPIRDVQGPPTEFLTPAQCLIVRAAIAAVNAIDLRDGDDDVTSRTIRVPVDAFVAGSKAYEVTVFGTERQPYISEVFAHVDPTDATKNYIAVELCNPYPIAITLTNWQIATLARTTAGYATMKPVTATAPGAMDTVIIPAATATAPGFVVLEDSVGSRPADVTTELGARTITPTPLAGLLTALTTGPSELVLLRPRLASGTLSIGTAADNTFNEGIPTAPTLSELVPADQVDLAVNTPPATAYRLTYRRGSNGSGTTTNYAWNFVYPGQYSVAPAVGAARAQGVVVGPVTDVENLGAADDGATTQAVPTYTTTPLQLSNTDMGGWNKPTGAGPYMFPFGGFARDIDILQVPFVGAYRVLPTGTVLPTTAADVVVEMNGPTMDSAFADDMVVADDLTVTDTVGMAYKEQVGRFCPVGDPVTQTDDFGNVAANYRYHWAMDLLDYLTVRTPNDDYLVNVDQALDDAMTTPVTQANYPPRRGATPVAANPVGNAAVKASLTQLDYEAPNTTEEKVGVDGLINVNTAPWQVLARVPFFPPGNNNISIDPLTGAVTATPNTLSDNEELAKAIVSFRDGLGGAAPGGPFHTLYDLYKVPAFRNANDQLLAADPDDDQGDFAPYGLPGTTDLVRYDFKERFLLLNRVCGMLTTRSDTFTCYTLVQGWRNPEPTAGLPEYVVQRRTYFPISRVGVVNDSTASAVKAKPIVVK